ncbi:ABC transporter ATP-binding protein [Salinisphaera sp. USBA-960]|nr:ABC transporter ATP-binding protein [Salifodinibacter halophilus]NNC26425.1 ABC transporter ATP-binding protein [Salifodinibacter halophilus]
METSAQVEQPDDNQALLAVKNLKTHFPVRGALSQDSAVKAVDGVSFEVAPGEVFGLVGESGSGKSTLGRTLVNLIGATSGELVYRGIDLTRQTERTMQPLRRELSVIFQDPNASLNPAMTIADGVGHPLRIHGLAKTRDEMRREVAVMLERVGLSPPESFLDRYPDELSGGQKQRLVIARALITRPRLVIADEPVAALDMSVRARVLELMLELKAELNLTYILITHDLATARFMCDRMGILYLGKAVEQGESKQLFDNPKHPYTRALLDAIPLPEAGRRGREKTLPRGEIPDAVRPPAGCRFHPRCARAFEVCGWEGHDLIEAIEARWTDIDAELRNDEQRLLGRLTNAQVQREYVRFACPDAEGLEQWLRDIGPSLPSRVFTGISEIRAEKDGLTVLFRAAPEPSMQDVSGRHVACHLHGVRALDDGDHVGEQDWTALAREWPPVNEGD